MELLVYPMNKTLAPLARYKAMLSGYDNVIPVAPRSFGFGEGDIAVCDGGVEAGIRIESDFDNALSRADTVLMDFCPTAAISGEYYMKLIQQSLRAGKQVLISDNLQEFLVQEGCADIKELPVEVLQYNDKNIVLNDEPKLLELPVPCVFVFGAGELTNKFDIQLGLRGAFQRAGYAVTQLGTKKYSPLFGFDPLPRFILEPGDSQEKVLNFNHYVYEKAKAEKADVVIIGIPDGILPIDPYEFTGFGETAFLIGSALKADAAVLSLYAAPYPPETLQYLTNICKYRFGAPTKYINLACNDMMVSPESLEFQTLSLSINHVITSILPQITSLAGPIYAVMEPQSMQALAGQIIAELESNI